MNARERSDIWFRYTLAGGIRLRRVGGSLLCKTMDSRSQILWECFLKSNEFEQQNRTAGSLTSVAHVSKLQIYNPRTYCVRYMGNTFVVRKAEHKHRQCELCTQQPTHLSLWCAVSRWAVLSTAYILEWLGCRIPHQAILWVHMLISSTKVPTL